MLGKFHACRNTPRSEVGRPSCVKLSQFASNPSEPSWRCKWCRMLAGALGNFAVISYRLQHATPPARPFATPLMPVSVPICRCLVLRLCTVTAHSNKDAESSTEPGPCTHALGVTTTPHPQDNSSLKSTRQCACAHIHARVRHPASGGHGGRGVVQRAAPARWPPVGHRRRQGGSATSQASPSTCCGRMPAPHKACLATLGCGNCSLLSKHTHALSVTRTTL